MTFKARTGSAGDFDYITLKGASAPYEVVINEDQFNIDFRVESDTDTHMLFVDAGNNRVGIGTSTPASTLDVDGHIQATDISVGDDLDVENVIRTQNVYMTRKSGNSSPMLTLESYSVYDCAMSFGVPSGQQYTVGIDNGSSDTFKIYDGALLGTTDNDTIFEYKPTTHRVGIGGLINDNYKFTVYMPSTDPGLVTDTVALFENDRLGSGAEFNIPNRGIHIACGVNSANVGSMIGNAIIMRLSHTNYSDVGQIYYNSSGNLYFSGTAISDERRKTNIVDTSINGVDILKNVDVYDFNWRKKDPSTDDWGDEYLDYIARGYIAQRVDPVYPLATRYNEDMDLWEVPKEELVPVLHKAILQQDEKITSLENDVSTLLGIIVDLTTRLEAVEASIG